MYIDNLTLLGVGAALAVGILVLRLMSPEADSRSPDARGDDDDAGDDGRFARS
jgi:hypothetical protein